MDISRKPNTLNRHSERERKHKEEINKQTQKNMFPELKKKKSPGFPN